MTVLAIEEAPVDTSDAFRGGARQMIRTSQYINDGNRRLVEPRSRGASVELGIERAKPLRLRHHPKAMGEPLPKLLAVVGPTAAGKSSLALDLAEGFGLPILCCDSVQVFRRLDIGSAKPSKEDQTLHRHEMLDLVDPDESFSAGDYARQALELLTNGPAILCGGTGLYLRQLAWTHSDAGIGDLARQDPRRASFEAEWEERDRRDPGATHRKLATIDPATAAEVHSRNVVRCVRNLWLCEFHGRPISEVRAADPPKLRLDLRCIYLQPDSDQLRVQIDSRCDEMLRLGWLAEVEGLVADGYDARLKSMRSLGYKQLCAHLQGEMTLDEAVVDIKSATWQYARRQRTWFKHQLPAERTWAMNGPAKLPRREIEAFLEATPT
jgi:tRNA dimethylallyltransferase